MMDGMDGMDRMDGEWWGAAPLFTFYLNFARDPVGSRWIVRETIWGSLYNAVVTKQKRCIGVTQMVKRKSKRKRARKQAKIQRPRSEKKLRPKAHRAAVVKLGPNTPHGLCSERLSGLGGLLALAKFIDLIGLQAAFGQHYVSPKRRPKLGCYRMVLGVLMMLFVGSVRCV